MAEQRAMRQNAVYVQKGLASAADFTARLNDQCGRMAGQRMKLVAAVADTTQGNIVEGVWLFFSNVA